MKTNRWLKNVIKETESFETRMPWERGATRKALIARLATEAKAEANAA